MLIVIFSQFPFLLLSDVPLLVRRIRLEENCKFTPFLNVFFPFHVSITDAQELSV